MSATKIIINGAFGKMGALAATTLKQHSQFEVVAELGRTHPLAEAIQETQANIVIDFTQASVVFENTQTILESGACPVIGTSGLVPEQIQTLKTLAHEKKLGGLIVPNFSLATVLLMKVAAEMSIHFPRAEIIEMHHDKKQDSPSGTAIATAEKILQHKRFDKNTHATEEVIAHARGADYHNLPIHSVRLPGLLAKEQVIFGGPGETLTLEANTLDRSAFMPGLVKACEAVMKLDSLNVGLDAIL